MADSDQSCNSYDNSKALSQVQHREGAPETVAASNGPVMAVTIQAAIDIIDDTSPDLFESRHAVEYRVICGGSAAAEAARVSTVFACYRTFISICSYAFAGFPMCPP